MNHTITTLGTWWNSLADVPLSQQLDELKSLLLLANTDEPQHIGLDDKYTILKALAKVVENHTNYVKANVQYRKGFHTKYSIPLNDRRKGQVEWREYGSSS